jgi:hypothetical protein
VHRVPANVVEARRSALGAGTRTQDRRASTARILVSIPPSKRKARRAGDAVSLLARSMQAGGEFLSRRFDSCGDALRGNGGRLLRRAGLPSISSSGPNPRCVRAQHPWWVSRPNAEARALFRMPPSRRRMLPDLLLARSAQNVVPTPRRLSARGRTLGTSIARVGGRIECQMTHLYRGMDRRPAWLTGRWAPMRT